MGKPKAESTARALDPTQKEIAQNARTLGDVKEKCAAAQLSRRKTDETVGAWRAFNASTQSTGATRGIKTSVAILCIGVAVTLAGCGNYKDGDFNQPEDLNSGGDIGRLLRGAPKPSAKWGSPAPAPVAQIQYLEVLDKPGFYNDGAIGLTASAASTTFFVAEEQFKPAGQIGTTAMKVSGGAQTGSPITMSSASGMSGWWQKSLTATELPAGEYTIRFVRLDANGLEIAEAQITEETTPFGGSSITVALDGLGNFYRAASEAVAGAPGNTGDLVKTRLLVTRNASNKAEYALYIRTKGAKARVVGSWDNFQEHDLLTADTNGWAGPINLGAVADGLSTAFVQKVDGDSSDTGTQGSFDLTGSKYLADLPVGTTTKKGLRFLFADGVVFGGAVTTAPTLTGIQIPTKATVVKGQSLTIDRIVGVYGSTWRTSLLAASGITGQSSAPGAVSVQGALTYTALDIGTANITVFAGAVTSNTMIVTVVGGFKDWAASVDKVSIKAAIETAQIVVSDQFNNAPDAVVQPTAIDSLNPDIAVATVAGVVVGRNAGAASFRVHHRGQTKTVTVTVTSHVDKIVAVASKSPVAATGEGAITVTRDNVGVADEDITKASTTLYSADKPDVLAVAADGSYKGLTAGAAVVTVTDTVSGKTTTVSITVNPKPFDVEFVIPKTTLAAGETTQASFNFVFSGAPPADKAGVATWRSSNDKVATVSATGLVRGVGGGTTEVSAEYLGIRRAATVTSSAPPAPITVTSITAAPASITLANTATTAVEVTCTTGLSDGSSRASANVEVTLSAGAPVTATVTGNRVSFLPIANRSGSGTATIKETGSTPTATVSITVSAVLASVDPVANLTLQVGTTSQLPGLTGKLNNTADSGGATTVTLAFNKVTSASSNTTVAAMNATGLVTAGSTVGTATITVTSVDVPTVTRTFTVTTTTTPPPVTVTSVTASPASITLANTATTAVEVTCTTGLSDGSSRASANLEVTLSAGAPVTATVTGNRVSFLPIANRSGSGTATIKETGSTPTATVSITVSAVLASVDPVANLTLQVGTTSQLPGITGKLNNTADSGGATTVTLAFNKVTSSSTDVNVAAMNATGLVTTSAAAVATITVTSVDVPSVTRTFTVTVTPAAVGTHGDSIAGGTFRVGFDGTNPDGTTNVDLFFSQAKVPGDKSAPFVLLYRPDTAPTAPASNFALTTVATASDGSLWWKMTVTVRTSGEQLILNYGGKYPTSWGALSGSTLYNSGTPGDGLTPIITPSALTVVKGPMR